MIVIPSTLQSLRNFLEEHEAIPSQWRAAVQAFETLESVLDDIVESAKSAAEVCDGNPLEEVPGEEHIIPLDRDGQPVRPLTEKEREDLEGRE